MNLLGLSLVYERSPRFNDLLKAQGQSFKTIVSRRKDLLTGLFSISNSLRFLKGQSVCVAYLGDFRIEKDLKIAAFWRKHYGQVLNIFSNEESLKRPQIFITAILKENKLAHKTLVENPRKQSEFKYHFLRSVKMINILSKPFLLKTKTRFRVRYVEKNEEEKLISFIEECEKEKTLGFDFVSNQKELWEYRKAHFPGFGVNQFLVVESATGDWIATTLPSSPDPIKRMVLQKISRTVRIFFSTLRFLGIPLPQEGESIKTLYLTHFNILKGNDPKKVIDSIIYCLQDNKISSNYHMISFADWWNKTWNEYLTYSTDVNLYEVTAIGALPKLSSNETDVLGFEMALV